MKIRHLGQLRRLQFIGFAMTFIVMYVSKLTFA